MKNKNNIIIAVGAFVVGVLATNLYNTSTYSQMYRGANENMSSMMGGSHQMPDGSMMSNMGNQAGDNMMSDMMMDMLANMKGKSGKNLEYAFIKDMIPHHQGAVDMAKLLLQDKTVDPQLQKFANDIITAQESEIKMMNQWMKNYKK